MRLAVPAAAVRGGRRDPGAPAAQAVRPRPQGGVRRGRGGTVRDSRAGLRAPGVSEQDRARPQSDADLKPPRELTPAFFGCYDWHSSVHGHWLLARLARLFPGAPFAAARPRRPRAQPHGGARRRRGALSGGARPRELRAALRPGVAAAAAAELREWDDPQARQWAAALRPLETAAAARLKEWLPKLSRPIRIGEHDQTAFAFGLVLDWARAAGDQPMIDLISSKIGGFYRNDAACPLDYEPSGQDFLSPCLAEADLMRRVLAPPAYADWLRAFLPQIPADGSAALARAGRGDRSHRPEAGAS